MSAKRTHLGLGIGWRGPLTDFISSVSGLGFVEAVAENTDPAEPPEGLVELHERGVTIVPHGLRLSLGEAGPRDSRPSIERLAALAERFDAPLVSEHIAFVRAGGVEAGHLLPLPRTRTALEVLVANVRDAQAALPVPLALEHIAALMEWPDAEMAEADFLSEVLERTDALLLLDVANLYANSRNHDYDASAFLDRVPLDRIAYVHVGGGIDKDGMYHDTHSHPVVPGVLELIEELCSRIDPPGVMLERDDIFPSAEELESELSSIGAAVERGQAQRAVASEH